MSQREFRRIEVDGEVFMFLQDHATPFVDTPNTVLRRLLLGETETGEASTGEQVIEGLGGKDMSTSNFVARILEEELGGGFAVRRPYRLLFESHERLVYFQNYNKPSDKLWYRLNESALEALRGSNKPAIVCFTNPADRIYYLIPLRDIEGRIKHVGWNRADVEVNIDHEARLWTELDWNIARYLRTLDRG